MTSRTAGKSSTDVARFAGRKRPGTTHMHRQTVRRRASTAALALGLLLLPALACAQDSYPDRRIMLVVPYTAGSGFDFAGRTVGQKLADRWGQPLIVDNKPGASGNIGAEAVANSEADGYTILVSGPPLSVSPALHKSLRFDPLTSF